MTGVDRDAKPTARGIDDRHQYFVVPFLRGLFGDAVIEPIRLPVEAKRYLCALEPAYRQCLSPDSQRRLTLQSGIMDAAAAERFRAHPFAGHAIALRRFDDSAGVAGRPTPPLSHFLARARAAARGRR